MGERQYHGAFPAVFTKFDEHVLANANDKVHLNHIIVRQLFMHARKKILFWGFVCQKPWYESKRGWELQFNFDCLEV